MVEGVRCEPRALAADLLRKRLSAGALTVDEQRLGEHPRA
jgi:hypothetical protein